MTPDPVERLGTSSLLQVPHWPPHELCLSNPRSFLRLLATLSPTAFPFFLLLLALQGATCAIYLLCVCLGK
jgi:hypothetical protein